VHERERTIGNLAVLAQLMAGAQRDDVLARAAHEALELWRQEVEVVVRRVLEPSPMAALEQLGVLVEAMDDLGPVARRALRTRLRRNARSRQARQQARQ
jgi:hypothetical protein